MKKYLLFLLLILSALIALPSYAAVTQNAVVTAQTPKEGFLQFLNAATPGTYATAYTGGTNGSKITALFVSNNDSSATHVVTCGLFNGGLQYWSTTVTTTSPAAGSYNDLAALSTWTGLPVDSDGNPFIYLNSASDTLQCTFATTITSGKAVNIGIIGADF